LHASIRPAGGDGRAGLPVWTRGFAPLTRGFFFPPVQAIPGERLSVECPEEVDDIDPGRRAGVAQRVSDRAAA
jgi:hypothetical protein